MITPSDIVEFLESCDCINIEPMWLTIGRSVYPAARYKQPRDYGAIKAIYVVGELPASYRRSSHTVFLAGNDKWYLAAYYNQKPNSQFHPLGHNFMLMQAEHDDIFRGYTEMSMRIEPCTA